MKIYKTLSYEPNFSADILYRHKDVEVVRRLSFPPGSRIERVEGGRKI